MSFGCSGSLVMSIKLIIRRNLSKIMQTINVNNNEALCLNSVLDCTKSVFSIEKISDNPYPDLDNSRSSCHK